MKKRFVLYGADVENPEHSALKFGLDFKLLSKRGSFFHEYIFEIYGKEEKICQFVKVLNEACDCFENGPWVNSVRASLKEI